jgi:hypothetical protein
MPHPIFISDFEKQLETQFAEKASAMKAASELLAKYPMLQVEIYDASSKSRTLVKQP